MPTEQNSKADRRVSQNEAITQLFLVAFITSLYKQPAQKSHSYNSTYILRNKWYKRSRLVTSYILHLRLNLL